MRVIFVIFEAVSYLHINWRKSSIYPINSVLTTDILASRLGGKVGELPTTYLGLPSGAKSTSKGIWNGVLEKCGKRLTNWKSQYLSWGGRLTLINNVINALPSYMMSIFPMPNNVSKSIDALRRNFLWQGSEDKKKFHLVKWEELIVSKNTGGLGIKNLRK